MSASRISEWLLGLMVDRGLSYREVRVLLAVFQSSEATALQASDRAGVCSTVVYRFLGQLVDRGLLVRREAVWPESMDRWRVSEDELALAGLSLASFSGEGVS